MIKNILYLGVLLSIMSCNSNKPNFKVQQELKYADWWETKHDTLHNLDNSIYGIYDRPIPKNGYVIITKIIDKNGNSIYTSQQPFETDLDKTDMRPDICLGTDEYHTPSFLLDRVKLGFENAGYSVKINSPYTGTIVPTEHYQQNDRVYSIMIEINRKIFYRDNLIDMNKVHELNTLITNILM